MHSPEQEGEKGAYSINVVDEVTQWQVVGCVERISENFLIPLLEGLFEQFPFVIRGFHSDNGSAAQVVQVRDRKGSSQRSCGRWESPCSNRKH